MRCCTRVGALIVLLLATAFRGGCRRSGSANPALILEPGAQAVARYHLSGTEQLSYALNEVYPATATLGDISAKLERSGWQPLRDDYLNPGVPSSHSRGWVVFIDSTRGPEEGVEQWVADWQNARGDVVRYSLEYRWPRRRAQQLDRLLVTAVYVPADVVRAEKNALKGEPERGRLKRSKG